MKNYYYLDKNNQQQGPVAGESLPEHGVKGNTLVWTSGMAEWTPAFAVEELATLFKPGEGSVPPPPPVDTPKQPNGTPNEQKPDNLLVWSILCTVLCCLPLGIAAIIYSVKVDNLWSQGRHAEARQAAGTAKTLCLISLGISIVGGIIGFIGGFFSALL